MYRTLCALALAAALTGPAAAGDDAFTLGEKYTGQIKEKVAVPGWPGFVDTFYAHGCKLDITLKGGQKYTFEAAVTDPKYKVSIALLDADGKVVAATKRDTEMGTAKLVYARASLTETYTLVVMCSGRTDFTLTSTGPAGDERAALEAKLKRLKAEVEETEKRLEALKKK